MGDQNVNNLVFLEKYWLQKERKNSNHTALRNCIWKLKTSYNCVLLLKKKLKQPIEWIYINWTRKFEKQKI